ncbi:MAG: hypothetical protein NZ899_04295 [Thermoguttaceae bacterium]|nr:hypothetical protein [Thermoguttaceae bacterium]MDW8077644.1 hypothetical protein [Thermoguttaceae bacterium]
MRAPSLPRARRDQIGMAAFLVLGPDDGLAALGRRLVQPPVVRSGRLRECDRNPSDEFRDEKCPVGS